MKDKIHSILPLLVGKRGAGGGGGGGGGGGFATSFSRLLYSSNH